jgi:hypothetical protein
VKTNFYALKSIYQNNPMSILFFSMLVSIPVFAFGIRVFEL